MARSSPQMTCGSGTGRWPTAPGGRSEVQVGLCPISTLVRMVIVDGRLVLGAPQVLRQCPSGQCHLRPLSPEKKSPPQYGRGVLTSHKPENASERYQSRAILSRMFGEPPLFYQVSHSSKLARTARSSSRK